MSDLIERAELIDKNMAQAKEIERLTAEHRIQNECIADQHDKIRSLQARVEELEGVLMTESEKRDLLSKEHYRNKIAKLQARVEALEGVRQDAEDFKRVANMYDRDHTAWLWQEGELIKSLAATEPDKSDE